MKKLFNKNSLSFTLALLLILFSISPGIQFTTTLAATNAVETPVALFETSLANAITSNATSMSLVSAITKDGTVLASSTYSFIIDEGSANQEFVKADCTSTVCTNMQRGISTITGTSTVASLQKSHRRGASVKMTDAPVLPNIVRIINGIGTFPNKLSYTSAPTFANGLDIIDKTYADGLAFAGAPDMSLTVKGIGEKATGSEAASGAADGSGNTTAPLVLTSSIATSTCQVVQGSVLVASTTTGKLDKGCFDQTAAYTLTASTTLNATTTIGASNINSRALVLNNIPYAFPSSVGTPNQFLQNNGLGTLTWATSTGLMYATTTAVTYASNAAFSAASTTIPGGTLSTNRVLHGKFSINWRSVSTTLKSITINYGGSSCASASATPDVNTDTSFSGVLEFWVIANNSTSAQKCAMSYVAAAGGGIFKVGTASGLISLIGDGTGSIDSTADKSLNISVAQNSTANETFTVNSGYIELLK